MVKQERRRSVAGLVKNVQVKSAERGMTYPTLGTPPSPETDKLQVDLAAEAAPAIAAAYQLIATLQHSRAYLMGMCFWVQTVRTCYDHGLIILQPLFTSGLAASERY